MKINENQFNQQVTSYEESLRQMYHDQKLTVLEIARKLRINDATVWRHLKRYNIKILEHWERIMLPSKLTIEQEQIMVGTLLGDASIIKKWKHGYYSFTQDRKRAGYVRWLKNRLKEWVSSRGVVFSTVKQIRDGKEIASYPVNFLTLAHPEFTKWYNIFYENGKKIVPKNIERLLTPLALALWYADDGSMYDDGKGNVQISTSTHGFTFEEVEKLKIILKNKYGIETNVRADGGKPRLYFLSETRNVFFSLVNPILLKIPCLIYKIPKKLRNLESPETIRLTQ